VETESLDGRQSVPLRRPGGVTVVASPTAPTHEKVEQFRSTHWMAKISWVKNRLAALPAELLAQETKV